MATWTEIAEDYDRVSPDAPCPVCGKPDWCLVAKDRSYAMCKRTASPQKSKLGYRHELNGDQQKDFSEHYIELEKPTTTKTNFPLLANFTVKTMKAPELMELAAKLDVWPASLERLNVGFWRSQGCWTFPLSYPDFSIVGIMRRFANDVKYTVKGSRAGLYLPVDFNTNPAHTIVTEGASDTAAMLDMGFNAVGRFNVDTCYELLGELLQLHQVTIIADNDTQGQGMAGSFGLQEYLIANGIASNVLTIPSTFKDIRSMKSKIGGNKCLAYLIQSLKELWR